ncbi:MAG TPA: Coagulation factor 5/8 type domain-containing protein [Solirubrobacteraceae bacterium]|nr:Coagulation factor 5/8 type domain-containing protein [Solirubrobacteraceae bacterium]
MRVNGEAKAGMKGQTRRAAGALALAATVLIAAVAGAGTAAARAVRRPAPARLTVYSLVHRCEALTSTATSRPIARAAGPFRMQAAALRTYLLYTHRGEFLTDAGSGALTARSDPGPASEWVVSGGGRGRFTMTNVGTRTRIPVRFVAARRCATYPEAQVDATGNSFAGASPQANALGTVEGHAHITAFEFFGGDWHCGQPWSPYGAPWALPASCAHYEQGTNGTFQTAFDYGGAARPSDMHGWPTFKEWPSPTALAEEGDYYTGVQRAWKAGLRIFVTDLVDNEQICQVMTVTHNPCNDMSSVHIQSRDLYALQNYIDAQSGGPGKGWFRIVTDPFQARAVINQGKLAVIEGVEVSRIFGCGEQNNVPQCGTSQVDQGLKEVHALGVRTFFPVHEFDNAFGGTKMIAGEAGAIVNAGNRQATGSFWTVEPCAARDQDAEQLSTPGSDLPAPILNGPVAGLIGGNPLPVYASGPHCNVHGLTSLGAYLINKMIQQHYIIQTDHMSSKTAAATAAIATAHHYSGIVSAHCCSSPQLFQRIYRDGGFVSEPVNPLQAFINIERADKAQSSSKYHFGFGWGSDMNGLGSQPGPSSAYPVTYPFRAYAGHVTFGREVWGQRTFDLDTDGLANYGLYADWLHGLQLAGGTAMMHDMFQGAESYLQTWERAVGVPAVRCLPARTSLGRFLRLGETTTQALFSAGQPVTRPGRSFRYCVAGSHSRHVGAVFNRRGRLVLIASNATGGRVRYRAVASERRRAARLRGDLRAAGF